MDTSWIKLPNDHDRYIDGCLKFLELAKENLMEGKTKCPCKSCKLRCWLTLKEVEEHILFKGFYQRYTNWIWHGNGDVLDHMHEFEVGSSSVGSLVGRDDMKGLLNAAWVTDNHNHPAEEIQSSCSDESNDDDNMETDDEYDDDYNQSPRENNIEENEKYKRLLLAAEEELYDGCQTFSKLSFLLHLFHIKCMFHWSNDSFNKLLELILEVFPQIKVFPSTYYEGKKIINDLGLGYEKIHACPSNCMLYWGEFSQKEECHKCHTSRWKKTASQVGNNKDKEKGHLKKGEPAKVMRYFPFIPRLQRIYASPKTAHDMRWHHESRVKDGKLRHPADGLAWQEFDSRYPQFASDPRNVRLALATDGFNPYRLMNTTYSTWPIVLIPYNLPPWLCMKPSSFLLSCIIPGKTSPGIDIDVYMKPLLHELKLLWEGIDTFDAYEGNVFKLRAALHSTINDFPAYAMLSGWSTMGYDACPRCTHSTNSGRFGGKICYVGHRKWLDEDHHYRFEGNLFDGTIENGTAPKAVTGSDILRQQQSINYIYGQSKRRQKRKKRTREIGVLTNLVSNDHNKDDECNLWNKKSVFF
ncbi:uncharacterized protein LOC141607428 [Silene latifolia]|uniref:uncharacterized protein LOC141607428 n=1 Tax=Silene latifolia TaxID=37657 RepID=UPI003D77A093